MAKKKTNISRIILRVLAIILLIVGVCLLYTSDAADELDGVVLGGGGFV